ncbi:polysaccharide deacetylase family protein [Paenibacillus sp. HB172176]|uniref:polysaccharide deacetylase family protein n=1 Tax=Paenibacillus sp. HB172176 TaxID=2493690 RepID=UPI00143A4645|nr:polysaccharide deacetylase family protein [Paenibacillus sp. HB172176]
MENVWLWLIYVMTFYAFLPGVISRIFGFRVFKKGKADKEIALTFDDGPDPKYTSELLDLLKRYDAKATFFVVGSHAESQKDVLGRMDREGHTIGIHNYYHKSNWIMRPSTVRKHIDRTNHVIEKATGKKSIYYRPPWGIVNLFDFAKLGHMQIILWSSMFGDWRVKVGPERMKRRMLKKLRPGEVLLLHDCGRTFGADEDAPANMLIALEAFMLEAQRKGYSFVGIDEMIKLTDAKRPLKQSLGKRSVIALWLLWESLFHTLFRLKKVGDSEEPTLHYRIIPYHGQEITFEDGGSLKKGDSVAELHFDNRTLSSIAASSKTPLATGIKLIREVESALPELADQLEKDPDAQGIKALYGITMIHRGATRLGFEVLRMPDGLFARTTKIYLRLLLKVLTNAKPRKSGRKSKERSELISPRILLMPVDKIRELSSLSRNKLQEETGKLISGVDKVITTVGEEAAAIGSKHVSI